MLDAAVITAQLMLVAIAVYQLFISLFGWFRKKRTEQFAPQKRFALFVAAHNEEKVVGALIENLKDLDYPKELYDIMVICDNCTDRTAQITRKLGVRAFERKNPTLRGKGYAIEWMLKELWKLPQSYDAVVMFDADNLASKDFLQHMNNELCSGSRVVQAYIDTKNPDDSWVSSANGIMFWFCYRFWQLPRHNLGMANYLGGTGMCFDTELLKEMGWGATSLVEDLEFTVRCVQRGIYPTLSYDARVYDEKPLTFKASARQRLRWMQGHFQVARKYFLPLLLQGIRELKWSKIDTALLTINVYNVLIGCMLTMVYWIDLSLPGPPNLASLYEQIPLGLLIAFSTYVYVQIPLALMLEKVKSAKVYRNLLLFPLFLLSWWPITFHAFFTQNNKTWSHTQHSRVIRLEDVHSKQAG